ncbi:MAG: hypothetical protein ABSH01_15640 [Terriglobia bacterium]
MDAIYNPGIVIRYCRPSGSCTRKPSAAMTEALRRLSEADEMQPLLRKASAARREVVIEVFHSRDGQPLLIHPRLQPQGSRQS